MLYLLPILVFGGILLLVLGLSSSSPVDPVQARLTQLGSVQAKNLEELELQQPFAERTFRPLVARLSKIGSRLGNASSTDNAERRLAMAGNPGDLKLTDWMGVKILVGIAVAAIMFLLIGVLSTNIVSGIFMSLIGFGIGFLVPEFWLGSKIKARQKAILKMIPDTLDLLTISVRAGLGFDAALAKVVEKLAGPLSDEFRRALAEVRVGKARRDALRDMVPRTNVQPLSNFIGAIVQAEQLGVSISKVLQVQSEQLRIERRQRAEEQAAKAPIKMLFPLVGCIFPALFLTILAPAFIQIIKTMGSGVIP
jgi:tight adherence protein C